MIDTDVLVLGGGLAGLVSALELARAGHAVTLVERKIYPFHRVCGEYVSNEIRAYVDALGVDLNQLGAAEISRLQVSAPSGRLLESPLGLGGFGISRYALDYELYQLGRAAGVRFLLGCEVDTVVFSEGQFTVTFSNRYPAKTPETPSATQRMTGARLTNRGMAAGGPVLSGLRAAVAPAGQTLTSRLVLGAFGKRSRLDKALDRSLAPANRSPYIGVKYHVRAGTPDWCFPNDVIALHNFQDGYCGISAIENDTYCLCYLTTRANLRRADTIPNLERTVLYRNPHLRAIFENARFVYDKPEVINEVSFAPKRAVDNHVLMVGDSAGLITPLCGNGMAMAIHGAKIASALTDAFLRRQLTRAELEQRYQRAWSARFARRLWVGRNVQRLFGHPWLSEFGVRAFGTFKPALRSVVRQTHGNIVPV